MTFPRLIASFSVALCVSAALPPALAQETREEQLAAARAEKSQHLHPYVPTPTERRIEMIERALTSPSTVYPFIGSVFPGGWLAVGPGYRGQFAESGAFDVHGAWSVRNYKSADATLNLPPAAGGRIGIDARANWLDAPKVAFHGVGNDTPREDKTSFLYRATTVGAGARIRVSSLATVGGGIDALAIEIGPGTSGTSIERVFTAVNTPGLGASPTYARSRFFAEVDSRESAGYTRRGGLYRVDWSDYQQTNAGPYSFRRLDAQVTQFVPLLRENWVIALRALASTTDTDAGSSVPYFLMPDLGGSRELRGYPSWRFRDRNRLLLTGEYRWTAGQFIDMALFLDAGKVAARRSDLDLSDLRKSYGAGIRFHVPNATVLRIEAAHTAEGLSLVFAFGPVF